MVGWRANLRTTAALWVGAACFSWPRNFSTCAGAMIKLFSVKVSAVVELHLKRLARLAGEADGLCEHTGTAEKRGSGQQRLE